MRNDRQETGRQRSNRNQSRNQNYQRYYFSYLDPEIVKEAEIQDWCHPNQTHF
jgi:hypothetical protein